MRPLRPAATRHSLKFDHRAAASSQLPRRDHVARRLSGRRGLGGWCWRARSTLQDHPTTLVGVVRVGRERTMIHRDLG